MTAGTGKSARDLRLNTKRDNILNAHVVDGCCAVASREGGDAQPSVDQQVQNARINTWSVFRLEVPEEPRCVILDGQAGEQRFYPKRRREGPCSTIV